MPVPEEVGEHLFLQLLGLLYQDLVCAVPCQIVAVFGLLPKSESTSRIWYSLITNSGILSLKGSN